MNINLYVAAFSTVCVSLHRTILREESMIFEQAKLWWLYLFVVPGESLTINAASMYSKRGVMHISLCIWTGYATNWFPPGTFPGGTFLFGAYADMLQFSLNFIGLWCNHLQTTWVSERFSLDMLILMNVKAESWGNFKLSDSNCSSYNTDF